MLQCGQKVVYGTHGVCVIVALEVRTVNRRKVEYYVLEPIDQKGSRFYVPTQNEAAVAKLRPLLSKDALDTLIRSEDAHRDSWVSDDNKRKQCYRELMNSGDRTALVAMVRTVIGQRELMLASGRKLHLCDENFLRDAQKLLNSEFSVVLGIKPAEVGDYIRNIERAL